MSEPKPGMTDLEINRTIAKHCGWEFIPSHDSMGKAVPDRWIDPDGFEHFDDAPFPKYVEDLNACHEAEKKLTAKQEEDYVSRLGAAIMSDAYEDSMDCRWSKSNLSSGDSTYRSTARQRALAFVRTIGKDGK